MSIRKQQTIAGRVFVAACIILAISSLAKASLVEVPVNGTFQTISVSADESLPYFFEVKDLHGGNTFVLEGLLNWRIYTNNCQDITTTQGTRRNVCAILDFGYNTPGRIPLAADGSISLSSVPSDVYGQKLVSTNISLAGVPGAVSAIVRANFGARVAMTHEGKFPPFPPFTFEVSCGNSRIIRFDSTPAIVQGQYYGYRNYAPTLAYGDFVVSKKTCGDYFTIQLDLSGAEVVDFKSFQVGLLQEGRHP